MENKDGDALAVYEKDFERLKEKFLHRRLYNIHAFIIRSLINCGIGLDYALPFLVSAIIIGCRFISDGNAPFIIDEIVDCANVETIDTSSGFHSEKISYDYDYDDLSFEYSTGWSIDDEGLYERVVTSYVTEGIDFSDTFQIFSMSKEEIEDKFIVNNIKTIKKNNLEEEDKMYDKDSFFIVQYRDSETEFTTRKETNYENFWHSVLYLVLSLVGGAILTGGERIFIKVRIKDKLNKYKDKYAYFDEQALHKFNNVFKIREENISLLSEDCEAVSYQLRKK